MCTALRIHMGHFVQLSWTDRGYRVRAQAGHSMTSQGRNMRIYSVKGLKIHVKTWLPDFSILHEYSQWILAVLHLGITMRYTA